MTPVAVNASGGSRLRADRRSNVRVRLEVCPYTVSEWKQKSLKNACLLSLLIGTASIAVDALKSSGELADLFDSSPATMVRLISCRSKP